MLCRVQKARGKGTLVQELFPPSCDCARAVSGGCQGCGLLSPGAPAERRAGAFPCLHCAPCKGVRVHKNSLEAERGWWAAIWAGRAGVTHKHFSSEQAPGAFACLRITGGEN